MTLILIALCGGLGLFISGMNMMSRGIEKVAGDRLRSILEAFTRNRITGLLVGLFFTAVIQSSSAATAMVVSFVNSGLMNLSQASGIILGANIGTTVTALLVAFRLSAIAPILVLSGAVMMHYVRNTFTRKMGEVVLGFGMLFVGISTMSEAMTNLRGIPEVAGLLNGFTNPFLGVLLGTVITALVQSSSVTVSILVVMGSQGLIGLEICMFVILGCNIGACASAMLAAVGTRPEARRAALIHLLFNVFGTILMFVLLWFLPTQIASIVRWFSGAGQDAGSLGRNIACAHLVFKVFQVIVLYPLMNLLIRLTYLIVPGNDEPVAESRFRVQYIGDPHPNPAVAVLLAVEEMERMANMAIENLNIMAAYTHTVMKEVSGMPGSNATSAWNGLYTIDGPNLGKVQNSQYVIPDRIIANISYKYGKEHFSLFYTGYSPAGYSFFYNGDVNGDGIATDLMYIPANDSEIKFTDESDRQLFWDFVNQDSYLKNHKGEYAEAYSARAPFVHRFDFRWAHDFDLKIGNTMHKLQLSADFMNIGNLFSSRWGVEKDMVGSFSGQFLKVDKVENGVPYFSMRKDSEGNAPTQTWSYNHAYDQCWKLQIGVKYYFN